MSSFEKIEKELNGNEERKPSIFVAFPKATIANVIGTRIGFIAEKE
jgi:hypothetical protein